MQLCALLAGLPSSAGQAAFEQVDVKLAMSERHDLRTHRGGTFSTAVFALDGKIRILASRDFGISPDA